MAKTLKIGITVDSRPIDHRLSLWSSGIMQNIVYLGLLFQRLPNVELVCLVMVDHSGAANHLVANRFGFQIMGLPDALNNLDVIVELGVRISYEASLFYRDRGGKLVSYMAGNAMIMNLEAVASKLPYGEVVDHNRFDAVWITPQHIHTNASYAKLTRSEFVFSAPHIWDPIVINADSIEKKISFKWTPPNQNYGWRLANFEPNINVLKTFHLPFLVAESAHRKNPDLIKHFYLMNTKHFIGQIHFEEFIGTSELSKAGRVTAEPRMQMTEILGVHANAVVAHQWENSLNYHYWEVLYGGFPLIHNSKDLLGAGYYYPEFDPVRGGEVLTQALHEHEANYWHYKKNTAALLNHFSIDNPDVQLAYSDLLGLLTKK